VVVAAAQTQQAQAVQVVVVEPFQVARLVQQAQ
jgi:hypothetical protein